MAAEEWGREGEGKEGPCGRIGWIGKIIYQYNNMVLGKYILKTKSSDTENLSTKIVEKENTFIIE